jgi:hypothetical protein
MIKINVCKPQEYPGFLRSHVNRKIDLIIKIIKETMTRFFLK